MTGALKIVLALVIVLLCATGFYLLDWQPRLARLEQETRNLADARAQLAKAQEDLKQLPVLTRQMEETEKELQELVGSMGRQGEDPSLFVAHYLAEIERLVTQQRVQTGDEAFRIGSITPGAAKGEEKPAEPAHAEEVGSVMQARVFQMQMSGRYATLVDFLYQLGALKLDRLVTIDKIALSPSGDGVLSITIPLTAYVKS